MNLSKALYIPGIVCILCWIWLFSISDYATAALICIFGTMCGLLGLCAALRDANYFKDVGEIKHTP